MFNSATLVGRTVRDAELGDRSTGGMVLRFTLAVDRDYEVDGETPTDFWPVQITGEYGARLAPHVIKGRLVLVAGQAQIDQRRCDDGSYRVFPYVSASRLRFLDKQRAE